MNKHKTIPIGTTVINLTVKEVSPERVKNGSVAYICECKCGNVIVVPAYRLINKTIKSCGCLAVAPPSIADTVPYALTKTLRASNTSGVTGVSYSKKGHKWVSILTYRKKRYQLGSYDNIDDAIAARKAAEQVTHEAFLEWYNKHKADIDTAPPSPDGSELETLTERKKRT